MLSRNSLSSSAAPASISSRPIVPLLSSSSCDQRILAFPEYPTPRTALQKLPQLTFPVPWRSKHSAHPATTVPYFLLRRAIKPGKSLADLSFDLASFQAASTPFFTSAPINSCILAACE